MSLGVDTAAEDPDTFRLVADDFPRIGAAIGTLGLPTLVVQEGGYGLDVIGRNVVNVLRGVEGESTRRCRSGRIRSPCRPRGA